MSERWVRAWLREFEEDVSSLLSPSWSASDRCLEPLIEVENGEDAVTVCVDLPCVEGKEAIRLNATEDSLEVTATMKNSIRWERWGMLQRNLEFGSFKRIIRLPDKVQPEGAKAYFRKGILRVTLPKAKRKVKIQLE